MDAKTKKGLIVTGIVAAIVAGAYFLLKKAVPSSVDCKKDSNSKTLDELKFCVWNHMILNYPNAAIKSNEDFIKSNYPFTDIAFMRVWDSAIQKNEPTFTYSGKKMDTTNGQFV
jgi:hypothetical protein